MRKTAIIAIAGAVIYSASGCSTTPSCLTVVPPDINLTGEKTVIERQIVGDYRELEKDAWVVSSVKTTTGRKTSGEGTSGNPEIQKALKIREYHRDKISSYKQEGALGETSTGLIAYRETAKYKSDKDLKKVLLTVIKEENRARKTIFDEALKASGKEPPTDEELRAFAGAFADEQRALARKGEWIQENSGRWVRKK